MYIVCLHNDSFRGLLALTPPLLRLESFIYRKKRLKTTLMTLMKYETIYNEQTTAEDLC